MIVMRNDPGDFCLRGLSSSQSGLLMDRDWRDLVRDPRFLAATSALAPRGADVNLLCYFSLPRSESDFLPLVITHIANKATNQIAENELLEPCGPSLVAHFFNPRLRLCRATCSVLWRWLLLLGLGGRRSSHLHRNLFGPDLLGRDLDGNGLRRWCWGRKDDRLRLCGTSDNAIENFGKQITEDFGDLLIAGLWHSGLPVTGDFEDMREVRGRMIATAMVAGLETAHINVALDGDVCRCHFVAHQFVDPIEESNHAELEFIGDGVLNGAHFGAADLIADVAIGSVIREGANGIDHETRGEASHAGEVDDGFFHGMI